MGEYLTNIFKIFSRFLRNYFIISEMKGSSMQAILDFFARNMLCPWENSNFSKIFTLILVAKQLKFHAVYFFEITHLFPLQFYKKLQYSLAPTYVLLRHEDFGSPSLSSFSFFSSSYVFFLCVSQVVRSSAVTLGRI